MFFHAEIVHRLAIFYKHPYISNVLFFVIVELNFFGNIDLFFVVEKFSWENFSM
jgi:hypothetical protein